MTNKEIVDFLFSSGLNQVVLSEDSKFDLLFEKWQKWKIFDRRSAVYFALGLSQESKKPVLILIDDLCDAALSDALPGITEAFYQNVPLFVLGLDTKQTWLLSDKTVIGDKCLFSCKIANGQDYLSEEDIAGLNYAVSVLTKNGGGPVFVRCTNTKRATDLAPIPLIQFMTEADFFEKKMSIKEYLKEKAICIVLDSTEKYNIEDVKLLASFCEEYNGFLNNNDVYYVSRYLSSKPRGKVDVLIEFGVNHRPMIDQSYNEHWIVSPMLNTQKVSNCHIRVGWRTFVEALVEGKKESINMNISNNVTDTKWIIDNIVATVLSFFEHNIWVYGFTVKGIDITKSIGMCSFANSASFADSFGKDGDLSIFIGQSVAMKNEMCICFIDEKTFFRDMNALHIQAISGNVRIVLFASDEDGKKAVAWATSCGFDTFQARKISDLREIMVDFASQIHTKPALLSVIL